MLRLWTSFRVYLLWMLLFWIVFRQIVRLIVVNDTNWIWKAFSKFKISIIFFLFFFFSYRKYYIGKWDFNAFWFLEFKRSTKIVYKRFQEIREFVVLLYVMFKFMNNINIEHNFSLRDQRIIFNLKYLFM